MSSRNKLERSVQYVMCGDMSIQHLGQYIIIILLEFSINTCVLTRIGKYSLWEIMSRSDL